MAKDTAIALAAANKVLVMKRGFKLQKRLNGSREQTMLSAEQMAQVAGVKSKDTAIRNGLVPGKKGTPRANAVKVGTFENNWMTRKSLTHEIGEIWRKCDRDLMNDEVGSNATPGVRFFFSRDVSALDEPCWATNKRTDMCNPPFENELICRCIDKAEDARFADSSYTIFLVVPVRQN